MEKINKLKLLVIYIVIWISFYLLSHFTPVCFGDDLVSRFVYGTDSYCVKTVYDCFLSVYNVYSLILGRMTSVFIVVLFDNILGKQMFDICNATVFSLVVFIMARYTFRNHTLLATSIIVFLEFFFIPVFSQTNLWFSGSANCLWASFFVMVFLWLFRHYSKATFSFHLLWICPFTLIAALCHEEFSLPISFGLLVYLFQNRSIIIKTSALPIAISFMIGTGLLTLAPGNFHRSDLGNGFDLKIVLSHMAAGLYSLFFSLRIFWMFVVLLICKYWNFLPEDIYRFIEDHKTNDLSSYYITRKDWSYYLKQVHNPFQIKRAELILRDIDFSSLPFYIRPIAPRLERYNTTTVSVRNSVIKIFNHYYLFVEKSVPEVNDRVVGIKVEY